MARDETEVGKVAAGSALGAVNRRIEESVLGTLRGTDGAVDKAFSSARERERLLTSRKPYENKAA